MMSQMIEAPIGRQAGLAPATELEKATWKLQNELWQQYRDNQPKQDVSYLVECLQERVSELEFVIDKLMRKIVALELQEKEKSQKTTNK